MFNNIFKNFYLLENIHISSDVNHDDFRFPVQYVVRPQTKEWPDYRGFAGRIASGVIRVGLCAIRVVIPNRPPSVD